MAGTKPAGGVRVGLCGLGTIGSSVARLLLDGRRGSEVVGASTLNQSDIGRPLNEVAGTQHAGPPVVGTLGGVLDRQPDVVILATGSFLADTLPLVMECIDAGANVISACEQLAYPYRRFPKESASIDASARQKNVTVLGTGINPGLIFDSMLALASGVCWDVKRIHGRRVVDTTGFGENIHRRLGIGYPEAEFESSRQVGKIAGHVGFPESIEMVCEKMGVALDGPVVESLEPLVARTPARTRYGAVPAGSTEGVIQRAVGTVGGANFMQLELVLHLRPKQAGFEAVDTFTVEGRHSVHVTLEPGLDPVPATAAQLVNSIPPVLAAGPGLKTVKDLTAPAAWVGDFSSVVIR
jgi:hypothetical protein